MRDSLRRVRRRRGDHTYDRDLIPDVTLTPSSHILDYGKGYERCYCDDALWRLTAIIARDIENSRNEIGDGAVTGIFGGF